MVLGVTGTYCAGKNVVTKILEDRGFSVIDVDALGHEALRHRKDELVQHFGGDILGAAGTIDRKALADRVFGHPKELKALEALVHPWMKERVEQILKEDSPGRGTVINAALLFHMELHRLCHAVLWVRAPFLRRFSRALRRDHLTRMQVLKRFWSQRKLSAQSAQKDVDIYYIDNSRTPKEVQDEVDRLLVILK